MFLIIFFIIVVYLILYYIFNNLYKYDNLVYVRSDIDKEYYWVRNKYDKENAANTLAKIKINMIKLIKYLQTNINKFPENMTHITDLVARTKKIYIMETPQDEKYTSYTVNKGEKIVFCLRSKTLDSIHDMNTLMYVVIHEMAHVGCPEYGHTNLFKKIFKFLLVQSIQIEIYQPIDYRTNPVNYCGMIINEYLLN